LSQLVHFEPVPQQVQEHSNVLLASQRSPQLTNGHELGGSFEQEWVDSMPIGDVFIGIMYRAWEAQRLRKRESLSPRALLTVLGRKYDQYLDFAQQDAHEFMRILLDAMRMEEFDVRWLRILEISLVITQLTTNCQPRSSRRVSRPPHGNVGGGVQRLHPTT
jgi:hypothetical protein